jgi:hypothetical protein
MLPAEHCFGAWNPGLSTQCAEAQSLLSKHSEPFAPLAHSAISAAPTQNLLRQFSLLAQGEPSAWSVQRPKAPDAALAQCMLVQSASLTQLEPFAPSVHFPPPYELL